MRLVRNLVVLGGAALACVQGSAGAQEAGAVSFAGVVRGTTSQTLGLQVPDSAGHRLALYETRGTHESTGAVAFLPGGSVRTVELIDRFAGITGVASYAGFAASTGYEFRWEGL